MAKATATPTKAAAKVSKPAVKAAPKPAAKPEAPAKVEAPKVDVKPVEASKVEKPKERVHVPVEVSASWQNWFDAIKLAAFPGRSILPILTAAYITTDQLGAVVVRASDLEVFVETTMPTAYMDGNGPLLVNARVLLDALKGIKGTMSGAQGSCERISVIHDRTGRTTVTGFGRTLLLDREASDPGPAEDYPGWPKAPPQMVAHLPSGTLVDGFSFALSAAGKDMTLPMLTAVRIEADKHALRWVATDRYRLAVTDIAASRVSKFEAQLHRSLFRVLRSLTGPVDVYLDPSKKLDSHVQFVSGNVSVTTRQIDATFPPYATLFPSEGISWTVERVQLIGDLVAAAAITEGNAPVRVQFDAGKVQVQGCEVRRAEGGGSESWMVAFNPEFLLAGLRLFDADEITITGTTSTKPIVLSGRRRHHEGRYLIMPVRLP